LEDESYMSDQEREYMARSIRMVNTLNLSLVSKRSRNYCSRTHTCWPKGLPP